VNIFVIESSSSNKLPWRFNTCYLFITLQPVSQSKSECDHRSAKHWEPMPYQVEAWYTQGAGAADGFNLSHLILYIYFFFRNSFGKKNAQPNSGKQTKLFWHVQVMKSHGKKIWSWNTLLLNIRIIQTMKEAD
jgi:hypothetical protein